VSQFIGTGHLIKYRQQMTMAVSIFQTWKGGI